MALSTKKKTEEERERERAEKEAQRRNSAYQNDTRRVRNSAVLGGYQTVSNSNGRNTGSNQKTSSATLQRASERKQIPSLQKTTSRTEQKRNYQEENARNAQANAKNDKRSFKTGKELQAMKSYLDSMSGTISSSNGNEIKDTGYKRDTSRKNSIADSAMEGFSRGVTALPMAAIKLADRLSGNTTGIEQEKRREERSKQAREDNPLAYTGGNLAGNLLTQRMVRGIVNDAVGNTDWTDTAKQAATEALANGATGRQALATGLKAAAPNFARNQLEQLAADTVAETIPNIANDIADRKSALEVAGNAVKGTAQNIGFNALMEIPGLASLARGTGAEARNIAQTLQQNSNVGSISNAFKGVEGPISDNLTGIADQSDLVKGFMPEPLDTASYMNKIESLPEGPLKNQMRQLVSDSEQMYNEGRVNDVNEFLQNTFRDDVWNDTVKAAGGDIDIASMRNQAEQIPNLKMREQYNSAVDSIESAVKNGRVSDAREAANTIMSDDNLNIMKNVPFDPADDPMDFGLSRIQSDSPAYTKATEKRDAFVSALEKYRKGEISADDLKKAHDEANYAMRGLSSDLKKTAYKNDPVAMETIDNAKLEISDVKKALGKKNGKGKVEVALSKKDIDFYKKYPKEKAASVLNRLNKSTKETGVSFRAAGKGETPLWDPSLMDRLTGANDAIVSAMNPDVGMGNVSGALYDAYRTALDEAGDTAKILDNTDLANRAALNGFIPDEDDIPDADAAEDILRQFRESGDVQNDDAIQAIGEMAAREAEAPQIPGLNRVEQAAQEQIPGMNNVNATVDNVNESVNGGTGRTDIPGMEDGARRTKTSQAYTNTGQFGGGWNEAEYKAYTDAQNYQYETVSEKESVERAWQTIREEGAENAKERLLNTDNLSGSDLDALMSLWRVQVSNARAAEALGEDATEMWKESNRIFKKIQTESTHNAQALQALAKWSRNTPEGMLARADAIINGRTGGTDAASASMENIYKKYFKDKGKIELSEEFQKNFLDLADKYQNASGREREELMGKMGKLINDQIPVNLPEKIKTYLMDSMLGNFRTLITRNAGGNIGFNAVEQTAERPLAALIDSIIGTKTGRRTQAGLSREALSDYMSGFGKGLSDEWADFKTTLSGGAGSSIHTARSGESTLEEAIANNRQVFSSFIGDKADQLVKHGLSVGDRPFYEAVYKETLGDYNRMYKAGQMGDDIQSLSEEAFKGYAEAAAKMNALAACYQDDSALAKGFMDLRKGVAGLSKGVTGVDILSQFAMPFVKTPANIISRSIEYSPLGFIKNAVNTGRDMAANAAKEGGVGGLAGLNAAQQNRLANETARNILGTGLFAGGMAAAKSGLISGGFSDDKDEKEIQKANGVQEYALHTGDDYRSIDWIPVLGNNLVASAAFQEAMANNDGNRLEQLGSGLTAGLESQFDSSMLQGLQRLFGNDSYQRDAGIVENVKNVVMSGMSQAIPSIIRQAAAFDDPYKRQLTGADKMDYYINNIAYGIPGLRRALEPKLNNQGEAIEQNAGRNRLQKALDNFILPYTTTTEQHNPLDDEAMRLSQSIGSNIGFVTTPSRSDITTDSYTPSDAEFTNYKRDAGELKKEIGEGLLQSDFYQQLNDTDKAETLQDVYSAAKAIAKEPYTGVDPDDRYAKVYKADGLEGVLSYINANINSKKINFDKDGKATGLSQANALGKFNALSSTGMSAEKQGNVYYNSLSASEQEKLSDFYNANGDAGMYQLIRGKALANEDGTGAIKIQEVLDYATSFPDVSEAVVNQLGSAASGTFKKEDGVWNYYDKNGKLKNVGEKKQYNYKAPGVDYGEATTQNTSGATTSNTLTVNAASAEDYAAKRAAMEPDYVGNVDINHRPIVINDDGSYSTTETSFQEKKVGDGYRIAHFTPITTDGKFIPDDELNQYIDDVLNAPDPMAYDKAHKGIVYKVDTTLEDGQKITDANLNKAFDEADAWDVEMHERQDRMYADEAKAKLAGNQSADTGFQLSAEAKASARYQRYNQLTDTLPDYKISDKDYDDMYHAIDADSNDSIKKAEVVAYLDSRDDLDAKEKAALFSVFGNSNWNNPYAGGATKAGGSGSGKKKGRSSGSGKGSSKKGKKIAFQKYSGMTIPSLQKLDSGRASLRSLSSGGASVPGLNLSSINLGSSGGGGGSIPSIASLMSRYRNLYG